MPARSLRRTVLIGVAAWTASIASLHAWLNLDLFSGERAATQFRVGFLPVT